MRRDQKEWLFNTLLILVIVALIAMIGLQRFKRPKLIPPPAPSVTPVETVEKGAAGAQVDGASAESAFPHLGTSDPFQPVFSPPPKAPTRTPTPKPTPSLAKATQNWTLQYPFRRSGQPTMWVFQDKRKKEIQIPEGKPYQLNDGRQTFEVTAVPGGDRYSVILKFNDQERKFSLLE